MTDETMFAPSRPRTGLRTIILIVLIAFALGIGATVAFVSQYRQWFPGAAPLGAPTAAPVASTTAPGSSFMPPPEVGVLPPTADERVLAARLTALAAQLAAIEARTMAVDRDAHGAAAYAGRAEAMLAVFAARRALDRGLGLGYVEPLLRSRFGTSNPRAIAALIAASRSPVTVADLRQGLDAIAPDLATGTARDGWWAGLRREISGLVVLHRDTTPSPRPADRLTRARQALDAGQVEAALVEVSRLPGAPSATAWTTAARRYVDAHRALDALETAALLGQGSAPTTTPAAAQLPAPAPAAAASPPAALLPAPASGR